MLLLCWFILLPFVFPGWFILLPFVCLKAFEALHIFYVEHKQGETISIFHWKWVSAHATKFILSCLLRSCQSKTLVRHWVCSRICKNIKTLSIHSNILPNNPLPGLISSTPMSRISKNWLPVWKASHATCYIGLNRGIPLGKEENLVLVLRQPGQPPKHTVKPSI